MTFNTRFKIGDIVRQRNSTKRAEEFVVDEIEIKSKNPGSLTVVRYRSAANSPESKCGWYLEEDLLRLYAAPCCTEQSALIGTVPGLVKE